MDKDYKAHLQYKKQIQKMHGGRPGGRQSTQVRGNTRQGQGLLQGTSNQSYGQGEDGEAVVPLEQSQPDGAIAIDQQQDTVPALT